MNSKKYLWALLLFVACAAAEEIDNSDYMFDDEVSILPYENGDYQKPMFYEEDEVDITAAAYNDYDYDDESIEVEAYAYGDNNDVDMQDDSNDEIFGYYEEEDSLL